MIRLAKQYGRYGYRKVTALLRMEGWRVNHKKVERLWGEEGLQLPHRQKKRRRLYHTDRSVIRLRPTHPSHVWAIDFVHDKLSSGRPYKMLTMLDEYTREALCVAVRPKRNAADVLDVLHRLVMKHGKPEFIRSDNGPEFIAAPLQKWLRRPSRQIALQSPAGQWSASIRCRSIPAVPGKTDPTSASTEHFVAKSSTPRGSTPPNKPRSPSTYGSDNTTKSGRIMPAACVQPSQKPY